jgi:hypothetical protein
MARWTSMEFLDQMLAGWLRLTANSRDVDSNVWGAVNAFKRAVRDDRRQLLNHFMEQERRDAAKQKT